MNTHLRTAAFERLAANLSSLSASPDFEVSFHLYDCYSGLESSSNGGRVQRASSIRKLFILFAALEASEKNHIALADEVLINPKAIFTPGSSGVLQFMEGEVLLRLVDLLYLMIIVSDNIATWYVVETLGGIDVLNAYCRAAGFLQTSHGHVLPHSSLELETVPNLTSASDVAKLLKHIILNDDDSANLGSVLSPSNKRLAATILRAQQDSSMLPSQLPIEITVGHKHGWGLQTAHDAGIVYDLFGSPSFILVVLIDKIPARVDGVSGHALASELISKMCRLAWESLTEPQQNSQGSDM